MSVPEEEKKAVDWTWDIKNLRDKLDRMERDTEVRIVELRRKVKLLTRLLVDKKIIGEEIAKSIEESVSGEDDEEDSDLRKWLLSQYERKKETD